MVSVLVFSFNSIAPILLLILLGYYGRRSGMLDEHTLKKINRFNFRFGFSSVMFVNLYGLETVRDIPWRMVIFIVAAMLALTVAGVLLAELVTKERNRKGVLVMAMYRSNYAIIGLVLVSALAGESGLELATIIQFPTVLYFNLCAVVVLSLYAGEAMDLRKALREIGGNPLILGLMGGLLAVLIRQSLPLNAEGNPVFTIAGNLPWLYTSLTYLSRMATPLALIVLGGQLELKEASAFRTELISGVLMRLVLAPAIGFGMAFLGEGLGLLTLDAAAVAMMVAAFGSPMAVASVVMSAEMGADDRLCGQLVVWTSILSMGTMFIITAIFRATGRL